MQYDTDEKKWALREEILMRNAEMHPNRAKILDDLAEKWGATDSWRMRKDIGTATTKIRDAAEVIAESQEYDPWQVAESMIELRDEIQNYLAHFEIATGRMTPPLGLAPESILFRLVGGPFDGELVPATPGANAKCMTRDGNRYFYLPRGGVVNTDDREIHYAPNFAKENAVALAPPPQGLASKKDVPGG